jgi:hypothetical protein
MKTTILIMEIITGLLFFTTIVCGLWLQYSGAGITQSNKYFHMAAGLLTSLATAITVVLLSRQ